MHTRISRGLSRLVHHGGTKRGGLTPEQCGLCTARPGAVVLPHLDETTLGVGGVNPKVGRATFEVGGANPKIMGVVNPKMDGTLN